MRCYVANAVWFGLKWRRGRCVVIVIHGGKKVIDVIIVMCWSGGIVIVTSIGEVMKGVVI